LAAKRGRKDQRARPAYAREGQKVEGRKSRSELRPDAVKLVKAQARKRPKGGKMSPRDISAEQRKAS
jgi:hypothetical protein